VIYLKNNNAYKYTENDGVCCLAIPNLGPTPPNWLQNATFSRFTKYVNEPVYMFNYVDDEGYHHQYYQSPTGIPVAFGDGSSANEFNSFQPGVVPSPSVFNLPGKCNQACAHETNLANLNAKYWWDLL